MLTTNEREYLLDYMEDLLTEYDYKYTREALETIIDEWECQKGSLIEAFKKHPNYVEGKFMIAFDTDYERRVDINASFRFRDWLRTEAIPYHRDNLPQDIKDRMFDWENLPSEIYDFFYYLSNYAERCVSESTATYLNRICPAVHAHAGQKTSRVVNKLCCYLGYDKVDGYNREFAKYADSLSPLTIKRHTILSINPLDYLTMSFGNSWASCHTIDKANKRMMPNNYSGCYSSGTVSYMLDASSMVLYTVDASYNGNEYWDQPKINRQMFHWGQDKLVQGRLYPQDNDGYADEYTPYRNIVQQIISTIFDFPNLWTLKKGYENASRYVWSYGTHYRDYECYDNCSLSIVQGSENRERFIIGATPICVHCGERHSEADNISCCGKIRCADCGAVLREDDVYYVDGEPYCRGCVHYCDVCEEYHHGHETYIPNGGYYVCDSCLERNFMWCDVCECYEREEDMTWVECEDRYVCEDCLSRHYTRCDDCEEYFPDDEMFSHSGLTLCESCYESRTESENEVC